MSVKVKVKHEKDLGAYSFEFSFKKHEWQAVQAMAGLLKATIPAGQREYDPVTHKWTIYQEYWKTFSEILKKANFIIEEEVPEIPPEDFFYNQGTATPIIVSREDLANQLLATLGITAEQLADHNAAKKAYRRKALELHPDRNGGDGSRMSELNSIWSAWNGTGTVN